MNLEHVFMSLRDISADIITSGNGKPLDPAAVRACKQAVRAQEDLLSTVPDNVRITFADEFYTVGEIVNITTSTNINEVFIQLGVKLREKSSISTRSLLDIKKELEQMNMLKYNKQSIVPHSNIANRVLIVKGILHRFNSWYANNKDRIPTLFILELVLQDMIDGIYLWWDIGILMEMVDAVVDAKDVSTRVRNLLYIKHAERYAARYWTDNDLNAILSDILIDNAMARLLAE